jgi:hypothetical protein
VEAEEEAGPSFVYFARRDADDAIKIGFSRDVRRRMRSIRALLKVRVVALAYMPGTMMDEREFHRRFAVKALNARRREVDRMSPEEKRAYMETARNVVNFPAPCGPDEIAARAIARKKRG